MSASETSSGGRKRKYTADRFEYLDQLVVEFKTTKSKDAREQVLANLANFAYDPQNYNYFRQLDILDLFIDNLSVQDETLVKFSIGGLCNLCLDPSNKTYINKNGLKKIINLLGHDNEAIILSTITTLMFLITPNSSAEITSNAVVDSIVKLSKGSNTRVRNLAVIFLSDICKRDQTEESKLTNKQIKVPLNPPET